MIGIGITTVPERIQVLKKSIAEWDKYLPSEYRFYIYTDEAHKGIPYSKNKCLKYLYEAGCDDIFLCDDDTFPIKNEWWKPYAGHKEPHLMYQFKLPGKPDSDMREIYRDEYTVAYTHTRGAMIYIHRELLDVVGGMDTAYGKGTFEHPDWTNRIHNAGLTTYRAMDVPNSHKLFYCLDQDGKVESTIGHIKEKNRLKNSLLYRQNRNSKEHKEFL